MRKTNSKSKTMMTFIVIASLMLLLFAPVTSHADNGCRPDQTQLQNQGGMLFGGQTVLAQTFLPSVPGLQVCKVKVMITKNVLGAGDVTLHLLRSNFAPLDAAVTIPGAGIPMGTSVQVFDFGCNGAAMAGMPFFGLKLDSKDSVIGAYSWRGIAGNVYERAGEGDKGWRNMNGGAGQWTSLGGWDYAFQIYVCN